MHVHAGNLPVLMRTRWLAGQGAWTVADFVAALQHSFAQFSAHGLRQTMDS